MTTLFLICFLVGLGVSAVSLFSSALHFHHGGFHFHGPGPGHGFGGHHRAGHSRGKDGREPPLQPIQLVGTVGKLTIPIREGGTGEIVYTVDGTRRCSGARSDDSKRPIARDTEVVITRYDKGIAYVCEFDRMIAR